MRGTVAAEWRRLSAGAPPTERMSPERLAGLPEPVRRWLRAAIPDGTPLWEGVEIHTRGQIMIGSWRPYTARQVLDARDGFIWAATARVGGLPVSGFDRFTSGTGEMRWRLLGILPVMTGSGPDTTRSAAGRFAAETVALLPTAFAQAEWSAGHGPDIAVATRQIGEDEHTVKLRIGPDGELLGVTIDRWGNPGGGPYGFTPFEVAVDTEERFGGVRMMSRFRAGWRADPEEPLAEFFHAEVTSIRTRG